MIKPKNNEQSQPSPETLAVMETPMAADDEIISAEEATTVVTLSKSKGKRANFWDQEEVETTERAQNKVQLVSELNQRIAEVSDYAKAEGTETEKLEEALDRLARRMIEGRLSNLLNGEEVSGFLGKAFGFKTKKNGEPSSTPDGKGEGVRKRIVRVVNAKAWLDSGQSDDAFFRGMEPDSVIDSNSGTTAKAAVQRLVENVLRGPENDGTTIWQAYPEFGKVKTAAQPARVAFAFDPKRVRGFADSLLEDIQEAGERVATSQALQASYKTLRKAINLLGEAITEYLEEHQEEEAA